MSKASVKKNLQKLDKEKLIDILMGVYDFNKESKTYIENVFEPQHEKQLEKYKKLMDKEFYPWGGGGLSFKLCRQAITEFTKLNPPTQMLAELKLYLAQCATHYTQYSEQYGVFYDKVLNAYRDALEFIAEHGLVEHFAESIIKIYKEAEGGYCFPDSMKELAQSICQK